MILLNIIDLIVFMIIICKCIKKVGIATTNKNDNKCYLVSKQIYFLVYV